MAMRPPRGRMRHRITIQRKSDAGLDTHGQPSGVWEDLKANVPAEIRTLSGIELEIAQRTFAEATHRITVDYIDGLTSKDRIQHHSTIFHIGHVDNVDMDNVRQQLTVAQRV